MKKKLLNFLSQNQEGGIINILIVVFVIIVVLVVVWIRFGPAQKISFLSGKDNIVSRLVCSYPVRVQGDSMEPVFRGGTTVNFNKCFQEEDLKEEMAVVFKGEGINKIGIIREIISDDQGVYYKVSPEARKPEINEVYFQDIIAWKSIDNKKEPLTGCDWRPGQDYGLCEMLLGYYFDGERCVALSGCGVKGDVIPFETLEECQAECEK